MPDIRCKDLKTGEIRTMPEPSFDVLNDGLEQQLAFICYVDERGVPIEQTTETLLESFKAPEIMVPEPTGSENLPKKRGPKPKA